MSLSLTKKSISCIFVPTILQSARPTSSTVRLELSGEGVREDVPFTERQIGPVSLLQLPDHTLQLALNLSVWKNCCRLNHFLVVFIQLDSEDFWTYWIPHLLILYIGIDKVHLSIFMYDHLCVFDKNNSCCDSQVCWPKTSTWTTEALSGTRLPTFHESRSFQHFFLPRPVPHKDHDLKSYLALQIRKFSADWIATGRSRWLADRPGKRREIWIMSLCRHGLVIYIT